MGSCPGARAFLPERRCQAPLGLPPTHTQSDRPRPSPLLLSQVLTVRLPESVVNAALLVPSPLRPLLSHP